MFSDCMKVNVENYDLFRMVHQLYLNFVFISKRKENSCPFL